MTLCLLLGLAVAAPPSADALKQAWEAAEPALNRWSPLPITLPGDATSKLAAGEVVRSRVDLPGADRVIGAMWTPTDRDALWVAILDDQHFDLVSGLIEEQLPGTGALRKLLYQHLDLPWPVEDRQWVIDLKSNTALATGTGGAVWERAWTLADNALAPHPDPAALWTTVNEGGFLLVDAAGGTLIIYHVRTEIGGSVPDEATSRWAWSTLEDLLRGLVKRAAGVPAHYVAGHAPFYRPDGRPVPVWPR